MILSANGRKGASMYLNILYVLSLSIALSTCILQLEIFREQTASSLVNWVLPHKNAGKFKKTFFGSKSCMTKPLSARIRSPAYKKG